MSKRRSKRKRPLTKGHGVGKGHGNTAGPMPKIVLDRHASLALNLAGDVQSGTLVHRMGKCLIFLSSPTGSCGWHMSISREDRLPSWDEIAHARYELIPNEVTMAAVLPPRDEYINLHSFCMQVHEIPAAR